MPRLRLLRTVPLALLLLLAPAPQLHASDLKPTPASYSWNLYPLWNWLTDWARPAGFIGAFDLLGKDMDPDGGNADLGKDMDPNGTDGDLGHDMDPNG